MKKYIYAMVVLMAGLFASCSNDDIVIEGEEPNYTLTCNISTQKMYDTFGITQDVINDVLRNKVGVVGVNVFLFNEDGNLVESKLETTSSFNNIYVEFSNVKAGHYSLLTVETIVDPNNNNKAQNWSLEGMNNIKTISIAQQSKMLAVNECLGVASTEVDVKKNGNIVITPNAIGSIINVFYPNFFKSTFKAVGFATQDVLKTYKLDPSLPRKDRFVKDLTPSENFNIRAGMIPDKTENSYNTIYVLESDIEWYLTFTNDGNGWASSYNGYETLEDGNNYYAGIYYYGDNYICPCYFGNNSGYEKWLANAEKNQPAPTPDGEIYPTPFTTWSSTVSAVKTYMSNNAKDYRITYDVNGNDEEGYDLTYMHNSKKIQYTYTFSSKTSGLNTVGVMLQRNETTLEKLMMHIESEGYIYIDKSDDIYMYVDKDATTIVGLIEYPDYDVYNVVYFSSSVLGARGIGRAMNYKDIIGKNMPEMKGFSKKHKTVAQCDINKMSNFAKLLILKN